MPAASSVVFSQTQHFARITLSRPQAANALDLQAVKELARAAKAAKQSPARAVVISGEGKHFCAGADAKWFAAANNKKQNIAEAKLLAETLRALYELPKPLIALVQGACYGGGIGIAAVADICIAHPAAKFCFGETRLGLTPATISPFVVRAIGERQARRYFQSAEVIDAKTAMQIGLAHELANDLQKRARAIGKQLMQNAPKAMALAKQLPSQVSGRKINAALSAQTAARLATARASKEGREGLNAFLQKRKPQWNDG